MESWVEKINGIVQTLSSPLVQAQANGILSNFLAKAQSLPEMDIFEYNIAYSSFTDDFIGEVKPQLQSLIGNF